MYAMDKRTGFSNEGFRVRRMNPDRTYPSVKRQIGFVESVDLTNAKATDVLSYRWEGKGDFTDVVCDLTSVGTVHIATVDAVVTALNAIAELSAVFTASKDSVTERLMIADKVEESTHTYLELKGPIANILGFGKSGDAQAMGTAFVTCFDDAAAIGLPKVMKDGEEIEYETSRGGTGTMMIDALNKGYSPSLAMTDEVYELREMIEGGVYDQTEHTYISRTTDQPNAPICYLEVFVGKYTDGAVHRGDAVAYKQYSISNMTGFGADVSHEVKSWATYQYDCKALEYVDSDGVKHNPCVEKELTVAQAIALGLVS